jgi:2-methylaconitate cis-trans-isomerase PrpF
MVAPPWRSDKTRERVKEGGGGQGHATSLGWLIESMMMMPKMHKAIKGFGAVSIVELKAQFYHTQEKAHKVKDSDPSSSIVTDTIHARKNFATMPNLFS